MAEEKQNQALREIPLAPVASERKRALFARYARGEFGKVAQESSIARRPGDERVPISFGQQQIWLHQQMASNIPFYNETMTVRRHGSLNASTLERCLVEIVRRHEIWRTTFEVVGEEPVQIIHPAPAKFPIQVIDLRSLPDSEREREAVRLATADVRRPFDLAKGPLLRVLLVSTSDEDHRLYMTFHHLIFDAVTAYWIFLPELEALYEAFSIGEASPLSEPNLQYGDFAYWQRRKLSPESWSEHIEYWRKQLEGDLPVCEWPSAHGRPAVETHRGEVQRFALPAALTELIRSRSQQAGVSVYMTLLGGLVALLHRYTGQDDLLLGSLTSGRTRAGLEQVMGYFINPLPLRIDVSGEPTFRELLLRVRKVVLDGLSHESAPFLQIVEEVQRKPDPSRNPLFQIVLSQQPQLKHAALGWDLVTDEISSGGSQVDLTIVIDDRGGEIAGPIIYNPDLFDLATIRRMIGHWQLLLEGGCEEPTRKIGDLPLLTEPERHKILVEWNDTAEEYAPVPTHKIFEAQAAKTPHAVALKCGTSQLSYAELNQKTDHLAGWLREVGVGPDVTVALCLEWSLEMVVGILATLKAGGAYVPLDPTCPRERLEYLLADCKATVLLTQTSVASRPVSPDFRTILLDSDEWKKVPDARMEGRAEPSLDNLAYVIYTSGSTGSPKGVLVTHGNLAHSNHCRLKYYPEAVGRFLLLSPYSFDSSVAGIFHTLTSGGTLVLPPADFRWQPEQLAGLIAENQISHTLCFAGLYAELLDYAKGSQLASLRCVIVAGEVCPRQLVDSHYRILPRTSLFNEYGPTEATVWSCVYECEPGESEVSVPIGRPIANTHLYVLGSNQQPVPVGISGELYIGGVGVAKAYLNRPDLTRTSFVPNPFSSDPGARLYRTGDLVRYLSDGNLEFLGRRDQQVKIHGLRIEPGEIETILAQHPDVREAAIVTTSNGGKEPQLEAYVVAGRDYTTSTNELRVFLKNRLPRYMVPSSFHFVSSLPRTPSGKLDRQKVLAPAAKSEDTSTLEVLPPRNDVERRLLAIWQRTLGTDSRDVRQDFFALGGHSLLAAKLLAGIEREFGISLSLAFVFQAPTVEQMAELLRTAGQSLRERAIIPIQPKGSMPPLFWIRGGPRFRLLAQKLGTDQPLLGLDIPYRDGAKLPVPYRMEDIATLLVQALQEQQPHGPYSLAGLCVNAVLAYEVARQLVQKGEEVSLLAMFDGHNHAYYRNPFKDERYTARIKHHMSNLLRMEIREAPSYVLDRLDEARRKIERITWQLMSDLGAERVRNTDSIVHPAFHRYDPQPYPGRLVLLQSSDWPSGPFFDFKAGWEHLVAGGIEFHSIPGDHPSMFTEPNVNLVAELLRTHLAAVPAMSTLGNRDFRP